MFVTKEFPKSISAHLVHFYTDGYLLLPIDTMFPEYLVDFFLKFESLDDFLTGAKREFPAIISLIRQLDLKTFVLLHYSEHGDVPVEVFQLIIRDGIILKHTKRLIDENDDYYVETILGYFTPETELDITPYRNYAECEALYRKQKES
jgi:hypothetical protein